MWHGAFRAILILAGLGFAALAWGLVARAPWMTALWPWEDGRLSFLFLGSVAAAFAAGSLWAGLSGRVEATRDSLVGLALINGGAAAYFALAAGRAGTWPHAAALAALALVPLGLRAGLGRGPADRPLPAYVARSCAAFALALALAGLALVLRVPRVFPWPLDPDSSVIFGTIFLGLSIVYAATAWRREEGPGIVVMTGFFAYDLVLLPPFLGHLATVAPGHLMSLVLYLVVLASSALVALAFLGRRVLSRGAAPPRPA